MKDARNVLILLIALVLCRPGDAMAQAAFEVSPTDQIPRDYGTWSLFLVCNPAWIVTNGDAGIADLFRRYRAFGEAIGPKNLAVWFWKRPAVSPSAELTDVSRSSEYCAKYKLLPSGSPHVLVSVRHPDEAVSGDHFVVRLNGLAAEDSALALAKLTDQILITGMNQQGLDADDRWRRLLAATSGAISAAGCYFNKISFSFKTGPVNAEISHVAERGC